jgi:regulation of enolase protein 1 (concanavalin A-like superfamily)
MANLTATSATWSFSTGTSTGGGSGTTTLPNGWTTSDIGGVAAAGSASVSGSTFTVKGSGADIWGTADEFRFVYKPLTGDGSITARVDSITNQNAWSKAGVMMRETLAPGSKHATMLVSSSRGLAFQRRTSTNGSSLSTAGAQATAPYWVRITRTGTTFRAYQSTNGSTWTLIGSATMNVTPTIYVGLAVTSHADGAVTTATFSGVQ